jgi:hypothetical protein
MKMDCESPLYYAYARLRLRVSNVGNFSVGTSLSLVYNTLTLPTPQLF